MALRFGRGVALRAGKLINSETTECITFVDWTKHVRYKGEPLFDRLAKIPNERGKPGPMVAILVRMGLKRGFPDYTILAPIAPYAGLYLEAKRIGEEGRAEQLAWRDRLLRYGYFATICAGADELIEATRTYMARAHRAEWLDLPLSPRRTARIQDDMQ